MSGHDLSRLVVDVARQHHGYVEEQVRSLLGNCFLAEISLRSRSDKMRTEIVVRDRVICAVETVLDGDRFVTRLGLREERE